jgi:pimeloyl-ACP methyl ester carboxylesterase/DNA-binding CsgD family transcriptional regulator
MTPHIRYCSTPEGVRIAYLSVGDGPPLVFSAWIYSNLEMLWAFPPLRTFFATLAEHFTVILYDKPGCGLSDRDRPALSLDDQVRALTTVIDHLGLRRLALFGFSMGGPAAIRFAVEQPDRVAQLILYASRARTPPPDDPSQAAAVWDATKALIRAHWELGSPVLSAVMCPGAGAVTQEWLAANMRASTDPETAIAISEVFRSTVDVTELLGQVRAPTLVMHRRDDGMFPFGLGRELAAAIPNARFLPLEGDWHALYQGEAQDVLQATLSYLDEPTIAARFHEETEPGPTYPDSLTDREVQVLRLVAAGKSNREIADWLVLSPHTVVRHISNIFAKTGVANRTEAATYAVRHTLV